METAALVNISPKAKTVKCAPKPRWQQRRITLFVLLTFRKKDGKISIEEKPQQEVIVDNQNNPLIENNTAPEEQVKDTEAKATETPRENAQGPVYEAEKAKLGATEFSNGSFAEFEQPCRPYEQKYKRYGSGAQTPPPQNQYAPNGYNQYTPYGYNNQNQYNGNPYSQNPYGNPAPYGQELYRAATASSRVSPVIKILSWISFGFSIFAAFLSFIFAVASSEPGFNGAAAALVCSIFPIAALVFGIILAKRRAGGTKFIIVGAVTLSFTLLFSLVASVVNVFDGGYDQYEANEQVEEVEELLGIDLPEYYDFYSVELYQTNAADYSENTYYIEDAIAMRSLISDDARFMTKLPNAYVGLLPEASRDGYAPSAILFYNIDDGTFNTLPKKNGTYDMLYVSYYEYEHEAYYVIAEYELYFISDMTSGDI